MNDSNVKWLTSPAITAQLAAYRKEREAEETIERLREALEACWLILPTNCDKSPDNNVVIYSDDDWQAVKRAESLTRIALDAPRAA